jgi:enterochelin esterase-like enzyme
MSEEINSGKAEMRSTVNAWIVDMKEDQKERTACQEVTKANPEKMEPTPGEKETIVQQQEIPNEEVAFHSLRACRNEKTACQEEIETKPNM